MQPILASQFLLQTRNLQLFPHIANNLALPADAPQALQNKLSAPGKISQQRNGTQGNKAVEPSEVQSQTSAADGHCIQAYSSNR